MHSLALITINHKVDLQTIKLDVCVSWLQKFEYIVKQYSLLSHCFHFSSSTTEILWLNVTNTFLLLCQFLSVKMSPFNAFQ